jgi:anti-sigma factor RsiW
VKPARIHTHACDRARAWVSVALDGELSQLERSLLDAHLSGCAACRAFRADVRAATAALRAAPLERLEHPLSLPHRRRFVSFRPLEAAAAVVAAAIGLGSVAGALHFHGALTQKSARAAVVNADKINQAQKRFQRRLIVNGTQPGPSGYKGKTRFPEPLGQ